MCIQHCQEGRRIRDYAGNRGARSMCTSCMQVVFSLKLVQKAVIRTYINKLNAAFTLCHTHHDNALLCKAKF